MAESSEITARRILVALDSSPHGLAALDAAVNLADQLEAELQGLFIEDVNLLRVAGLPFTREFTLSTMGPRPLNTDSMERALRAQAEQLRRSLASSADRLRVRWSFQVTRGHITQASLEAAAEADFLLMGRDNPKPQRSAPPAHEEVRPIMVVYDGSQAAQRSLKAARSLVRKGGNKIAVLTVADEAAVAEQLRQQCFDWFQGLGVEPIVVEHGANNGDQADALATAARELHASLLLINRDNSLLNEETIERLVNELDCPVGLVS